MATPAEIIRRRGEDAKYCMLERGKLGSIGSTNQFNQHGAKITCYLAGQDTLADDKLKALKGGIDAAQNAGHAIPDMRVYFTSDQNVQTIAFIGTTNGNVEPTVFLGGKAGLYSCKAKGQQAVVIAGGVSGGHRDRGIADQEYDGTSNWFGNPKRLSLMQTTVIHELGHVLHEQHDPSIFWDLKANVVPAAVVGSGWLNAAMQVSQYATKGTLEFVAEVFAGRVTGRTFPQTVDTAYAAANGP
jgi:hypothetical protein